MSYQIKFEIEECDNRTNGGRVHVTGRVTHDTEVVCNQTLSIEVYSKAQAKDLEATIMDMIKREIGKLVEALNIPKQ